VDLGIDGSGRTVAADLKPLLAPLKRAADAIDRVYWQQYSPEGAAMLRALQEEGSERARSLAELLQIHYGPWDRHARDEPFVGRRPRPQGVAFYPEDEDVDCEVCHVE
jgi:hypothetical protein